MNINFKKKPTGTVSHVVEATINVPSDRIEEATANLKKIAANITADDLAAIAKMVDDPGKLAMARAFMK